MTGLTIARRAFRGLVENRKQLLWILGFWFPVALAIEAVLEVRSVNASGILDEILLAAGLFPLAFVYVIPLIAWHRLLLFGERQSRILIWQSGWPVWRYFALFLGLFFVFLAIIILAVVIITIINEIFRPASVSLFTDPTVFLTWFSFFIIIGTSLTSLITVALPARAINHPISFRKAWSTTRHHKRVCCLAGAIAGVAFAAETLLYELVIGNDGVSNAEWLGFVIVNLANWLVTIFWAGTLSELYREFAPDGPKATAEIFA